MGLFSWLRGEQVIITHTEIIVVRGDKVIVKERHHDHHHHHPHEKLIVSSVALFDQSNPNLIITKTQGEIMADKFKKSQGVNYTLAFTKTDGTPGDADPNTISASSTDPTVANVVPNTTDPTTGQILGVNDGQATASFTALSKVGRQPLNASVLITIADEVVPPDTTGDATQMSVSLSDAFNQDGSPIV